MLFFKLAWLHMRKHWKQTLVILFAIAASEFTLVFISAMMEGIKTNFYTSLVRETGHLQIHANGWSDSLEPASLDLIIQDSQNLIEELAQYPEVKQIEGALHIGSLLIADSNNLTALVIGTQADTFFYRSAREGINSGAFLPNQKGIAVSASIAKLLAVEAGDTITLLTEDAWGSPWYISREITGIFKTDSLEFDNYYVFTDIHSAEELSGLENSVSEIRIDLVDAEAAEALAEKIRNNFGDTFEIQTWREIHGSMLIFISVFDYMIIGIDILLIIVAGTVITNAVLMSVFARTREFGTLRAIGLKKRGLMSLILTEGTLEGLTGSLLGLVIALPLIFSFKDQGLAFGNLTDAFGMGNSLYFILKPGNMIRDLIVGTLIAVFGSCYAGLVISRETIMQTLKQE